MRFRNTIEEYKPNVILFILPFYLNSAVHNEKDWRTSLIAEVAEVSDKYSEARVVPILTDGRLAGEKSENSFLESKSGLEKVT